MNSKKVSPSRRFLVARLRPFFRPTFLLSTFFLGLLTVSIWQYWQNPNSLNPTVNSSGGGNRGTNPQINRTSISPEENTERAAIGADLDNSQLLEEELAKSSKVPITIPATNAKSKNKNKEQPETAYSRYLKNQKEGKQSDTATTNINSPNSSIPSARDILNGNTNNGNNTNGSTNNTNTSNTNQFGNNYSRTNTSTTTTRLGTIYSTGRTVNPTTTKTTQFDNLGNPIQVNNGSSYNGVQTNNPYNSQTSNVNTNPTGINNNYNTSTTTTTFGNRVPTINNVPSNNNQGTYNSVNSGYYGNSGYGSNTVSNIGSNNNYNYNSTPVQSNYNNNTYNSGYQNNRIQNIGGNNQSTNTNIQSGYVSPEQQMRSNYQPNYYPQTQQR